MSTLQGRPPAFGAGDATIVGALLEAAQRVSETFSRDLAPQGMSYAALRALEVLAASAPNGISQTDLSTRIGLSPASVTRLVDDLALRRLVERRQHIHDRRTKMLIVTEAGAGLVASTRERLADFEAHLLDDAGQVSAPQLLKALQRIGGRRARA